jgi:hypothetical protein
MISSGTLAPRFISIVLQRRSYGTFGFGRGIGCIFVVVLGAFEYGEGAYKGRCIRMRLFEFGNDCKVVNSLQSLVWLHVYTRDAKGVVQLAVISGQAPASAASTRHQSRHAFMPSMVIVFGSEELSRIETDLQGNMPRALLGRVRVIAIVP